MNREDIIHMAQEAGFGNYTFEALSMFERFAKLIAQHEREACAKVCESLFDMDDDSCNEAEHCAEAIRARGQA